MSSHQLVHLKTADGDDALERESGKGYDLVFVGIEHPISVSADQFDNRRQRLVETFDGPLAIVLNRKDQAAEPGAPLKILVPTGGTPAAGLAIELALAFARANNGAVTVLHVFDPQDDTALLRGRARRQGLSLLAEARRLGERNDVPLKTIYVTHASPEAAIQRVARAGRYDLVVVGTSLREGATKFLGPRSSALLRNLDSPTLLVTL
jgi:nucleotide-binding universal stress UspA family protein